MECSLVGLRWCWFFSQSLRYLASYAGGTKKVGQQKESSIDLSKFLYYCNDAEAKLAEVANSSKIDLFLNELRRIKIGPSGQVAKLQTIVQAQSFLIHAMPLAEQSTDDQALLSKVMLARDYAKVLKRGIGKEKNVVAAKKKEYVTQNMQLTRPKELVEFLNSSEVKLYVEEKAKLYQQHLDIRR